MLHQFSVSLQTETRNRNFIFLQTIIPKPLNSVVYFHLMANVFEKWATRKNLHLASQGGLVLFLSHTVYIHIITTVSNSDASYHVEIKVSHETHRIT